MRAKRRNSGGPRASNPHLQVLQEPTFAALEPGRWLVTLPTAGGAAVAADDAVSCLPGRRRRAGCAACARRAARGQSSFSLSPRPPQRRMRSHRCANDTLKRFCVRFLKDLLS